MNLALADSYEDNKTGKCKQEKPALDSLHSSCSQTPLGLSALQMTHTKAESAGPVQESAEAGCKFNIVQPGSSVATALSEGESKMKHVLILEVNGEQFRTINYPLETVRPFIHDNVCLSWTPLMGSFVHSHTGSLALSLIHSLMHD